MQQVMKNYGDSVRWVYRHFPLSFHANAQKEAEATECAAKLGGNDAFWKFTNALFAAQPADPSRYGELASSVGISGDAFASCYSSASITIEARITADRRNALDVGATGTPYSIILVNGKPYEVMNGAYSYDAVKQLINQALAR